MNTKSLTPKQIAELLQTIEVINRIGDAVKARAVELLHQGVVIPGYEADYTSPHRKWKDEDAANALLQRLGLEKRERFTVELLTPAQAEKALKAKKLWPKRARGSASEDFTDPLAAVVERPKGNPTLKRVT